MIPLEPGRITQSIRKMAKWQNGFFFPLRNRPPYLCVLRVLRFLADERDEIRKGVVPVLLVFAGRVGAVAAPAVTSPGSAAVLSVAAVLLRRHQSLIVTVVAGRGQRYHRAVLHRQTYMHQPPATASSAHTKH